MKKFIIICLLLSYFSSYSQDTNANFLLAKEVGEKLVDYIAAKDFEKINSYFNAEMAESYTAERLGQSMSQFYTQYGAVKGALEFSKKVTAEQIYFQQGLELEKEKFNLVFSFNEERKLNSFRLAPYTPTYDWKIPSYVNEDLFTTQEIKVGDNSPLLAILTSPKSEKNTIVVVFVHGSGPNDMDESLGPNKLFKDLAYGLASNGIASIRYNKRSYDYPSELGKKMNSITIEDLVVNDAVEAIKKAKSLGAKKVILLGHSLGGHMAPSIADKVTVDGVIVLAGNSSALEDLLVPQYEHIMANDPESVITEFQLNAIKAQVRNIQEDNYDENTHSMALPLGLPASFWLSLKDYSPPKVAKKQGQPYLILNGERDYQVTPEEAKQWKNGNKNKKSKTIIYPKLNHMFYAGEGVLIPSEYEKEGHLEKVVLTDIIDWAKAL